MNLFQKAMYYVGIFYTGCFFCELVKVFSEEYSKKKAALEAEEYNALCLEKDADIRSGNDLIFYEMVVPIKLGRH